MVTQQQHSQVTSFAPKDSGVAFWAVDLCFRLVFGCLRLGIYFWSYPLAWAIGLYNYVVKLARVVLSFFVGGLQGVFRSLGVGVFGEKIHYAVLKENGQYLKLGGKSLEDAFTCQLYDYGIRKFLTVPELEEDLKVTQLQFWSTYGLSYLHKNLGLRQVTALHSSAEKLAKFQSRAAGIGFQHVNYSEDTEFPKQDVFIFFNRSVEKSLSYDSYVDVIKILPFIKKNLNDNGYAVIGNCFTSDGEIKVFEELLDAFGMRVEQSEDITRNILHSRKVLNRTHKNRKIAWMLGRIKQAISQSLSQCALLNRIWDFMQKAAGLKQQFSQYKIYILEPKPTV